MIFMACLSAILNVRFRKPKVYIPNSAEGRSLECNHRRFQLKQSAGLERKLQLIVWKTPYSFALCNLRAFVITDTDEKLIAAAAMIGESSSPKYG